MMMALFRARASSPFDLSKFPLHNSIIMIFAPHLICCTVSDVPILLESQAGKDYYFLVICYKAHKLRFHCAGAG